MFSDRRSVNPSLSIRIFPAICGSPVLCGEMTLILLIWFVVQQASSQWDANHNTRLMAFPQDWCTCTRRVLYAQPLAPCVNLIYILRRCLLDDLIFFSLTLSYLLPYVPLSKYPLACFGCPTRILVCPLLYIKRYMNFIVRGWLWRSLTIDNSDSQIKKQISGHLVWQS